MLFFWLILEEAIYSLYYFSNSASPWPCEVCNKFYDMMIFCKKVVAFLDSITEVDSRVFFPRQLCDAF